jgi:glutamate-ammonia-ligase adenylyltransferase
MRLRPSGNSGLMVVHIDTFASYQKEEAWTWEHQALVRARMVYGQTSLITSFDNIRHAILSQKRDNAQLCQDVASMREKMRNHLDKSAQQLVDVKQSAGGLADIEFLAQYFMLNFSHTYPALTHKTDNYRIFELLATHQIITDQEAEQLINSYLLLRAKTHSLALQNLPTVIDDKELVEERGYVVSIWQKYMKNC